MAGRPRRSCTAEASTLMPTSTTPRPAPQPARTANNCHGDETTVVSGSDPARNTSPHWAPRRGGTVARTAPAHGLATPRPRAGPGRVRPRAPGDRCSADLIAGIRAAQVPEDSPSTAKTMVAGARAARLAQRSAVPGRGAADARRDAIVDDAPGDPARRLRHRPTSSAR